MNSKEEFENHVKNKGKIVTAKIGFENNYNWNEWYLLPKNYTKEQYNEFLIKINKYYDSGYGSQELDGIILFKDSYSTRGEYDGSEWWENHKLPTISEVKKFNGGHFR